MAGPEHKPLSPLGGVKAFSCPNCGGQVTLRAPGQTLAAACQHCTAVIDLSDENLRILQKSKERMKREPVIPLGTRGRMFGHEWEAVGFMVRKVQGHDYYWEEYLLFNPWYGFRWLINNYGHWSFVTPLMDLPEYSVKAGVARYQGLTHKLYSKGGAEVFFVLGEFYWKVKRGDATRTADMIAPPYMLSYENDGEGSSWSQGIYLEPQEVQKAFGLKKMPHRRRIGANQPNKARNNWKAVRPIFFLVLAALIGLQIFFYGSARDEEVLKQTIQVSADQPGWVSPPFELKGRTSNVKVHFRAPQMGNSWIYVDGYLHDKEQNRNYGFTREWEYYFGRDSDGDWTEGSRQATRILNNIPSGQYELVLETQQGASPQTLDISVRRDVPFLANFWLILVAVSVMPLYLLISGYIFEKARWEEADV